MSKTTWIILGIIALVFGGVIWLSVSNQSSLDISDIDATKPTAAEERNGNIAEHTFGNPEAKVIIVEYGDYQCAGCATASPRIRAIVEEYGDKVGLVFRNYPITQGHPNAKAAAAAAEAAGLQGKYWEMHDLIYKNQSSWVNANISDRTEVFAGYAELLELDKTKFSNDLSLESINKKINFDLALGKAQGVTATPSFFIDNEEISTDIWGDDISLKDFINKKLTAAGIDPTTQTQE